MKLLIAMLAAALMLILGSTGCAGSDEPLATASPSPSPPTVDEPILAVRVPTDMRELIALLGEPDRIELPPPDEPSPAGQWFRWEPGSASVTVIALGDDYSATEPNFRADVRLLALCADERGLATPAVYGFELNRTTRAEVERRLGGLAPSTLAARDLLGEGERFRSALQQSGGDLYTYFLFAADERLVAVAQSTFSLDGAD